MFSKTICTSFLAAAVAVVPVQRAQANDAAAALGGAILGGIIVNEMHKNKQRQRTTTRSSGLSSAQREDNRSVQRALNFFGYNVGAADGALGRKSRAGISRYQADMGYHIDGYLDAHEKNFLLTSHQRALSSAHVPPYAQIVATRGQAGLLRAYRDEQLGIATPQTPQTTAQPPATHMAVAPAPITPQATAPTPMPTTQETVAARSDTSGGALPSFSFAQTGVKASELCNQVAIRSATNGGAMTVANLTDPELALDEQFCQARIAAIGDAARIEAAIPDMSADQIAAQCDGLAQAMAGQAATLTTTGADQAVAQTTTFLQGSGQPMAQLVSGGRICLGLGYRTDNAEMALASALLVAAAGQRGYGELVSHHLRKGMGASAPAPQLAGGWMQLALSVAGTGEPVLNQTPERVAVLTAASQGGGNIPAFPKVSGNN